VARLCESGRFPLSTTSDSPHFHLLPRATDNTHDDTHEPRFPFTSLRPFRQASPIRSLREQLGSMAQPSKTQILRLYRDYMRSAQSFVSAPAPGVSCAAEESDGRRRAVPAGRDTHDESGAWPQRHEAGLRCACRGCCADDERGRRTSLRRATAPMLPVSACAAAEAALEATHGTGVPASERAGASRPRSKTERGQMHQPRGRGSCGLLHACSRQPCPPPRQG